MTSILPLLVFYHCPLHQHNFKTLQLISVISGRKCQIPYHEKLAYFSSWLLFTISPQCKNANVATFAFALSKSTSSMLHLTLKCYPYRQLNLLVHIYGHCLFQLRRVFVYALKKSYSCPDFQWYYNIFSNDMVFLNSAVNFVIYTVCGKRFR